MKSSKHIVEKDQDMDKDQERSSIELKKDEAKSDEKDDQESDEEDMIAQLNDYHNFKDRKANKIESNSFELPKIVDSKSKNLIHN